MATSGNRRSIKLSNLTSAPAEEKTVDKEISSFADNLEAKEAETSTYEAEPVKEEQSIEERIEIAEVQATAEESVDSVNEEETPARTSEEMAAEFAAAFNGTLGEATVQEAAKERTRTSEEIEEDRNLDAIVEDTESVADALAEVERRKLQKEREEEELIASMVSDEVGYIAKGTKVHGDIIADGHLEIQGVVEGGINARGNVKVNGDVYGDIACGNLIINEGELKVDVQAREDISVGATARIEGDIRCRRISVEGIVVGNIVATELVQIAESATVTGNLTTGGIAIGMGATINGNIKMVK